jgi:hypothetical protein
LSASIQSSVPALELRLAVVGNRSCDSDAALGDVEGEIETLCDGLDDTEWDGDDDGVALTDDDGV